MNLRALLCALGLVPAAYGAQQTINIGTVAGDATGDPARTAFQKINANFNELYGSLGGYPGIITATITTASTNNYDPAGGFPTGIGRLSINPSTNNITFTGLKAGTDGQTVVLSNTGSTYNILLTTLDGSSSSANQFRGPTTTVTVYPGGAVQLIYSTNSINKWGISAAVGLGMSIGNVPVFIDYQSSGSPGLTLPASVGGTGLNFSRASTTSLDVGDFFFHRTANYVGGTTAHTNAALYAKTTASSGALGWEWNGIFYLDNSSTLADATQNLALAAVAIKKSSGATWARYAELDDDIQDSTGGAVTDEIDLYANGTQANANRIVQHIVIGPKSYANTPAHIQDGTRYSPQGGSGATSTGVVDNAWLALFGKYKYGIDAEGVGNGSGSALIIDNRTGSPTWGFLMEGPYGSGFLKTANDQNLIWSSDQTARHRFVNADRCLENFATTTLLWSVCEDGTVGVGTSRPPASGAATIYVGQLGVPTPQYHWGIPVIVPSSGTFSTTPSAGGLTLTTAITSLDTFCSTTVGCYMYFPLNAINGSNAAGVYYATCTSTTVCSVYNNALTSGVPTTVSSPTSFGTVAGGGYTQTTGAQLPLVTVTIAANQMGKNGNLAINTQAARISNANTVVQQYVWGGSSLGTVSTASVQWEGMSRLVHNQGATNVQFIQQGATPTDSGSINAAPTPLAIDTTTTNSLVVKAQLSTAATDWFILLSGDVVASYAP